MNRISPTIDALRRKLGEARHGGKFFSSEEIEGLLFELRSIQDGAVALEDAQRRRPVPMPTRQSGTPSVVIGATPIGTIYFQPAGAQ